MSDKQAAPSATTQTVESAGLLEIGTFTGWSSIAMAQALPPGGGGGSTVSAAFRLDLSS